MRSDRIGPFLLTRFSATTVRRVLDLNRVTMRQPASSSLAHQAKS